MKWNLVVTVLAGCAACLWSPGGFGQTPTNFVTLANDGAWTWFNDPRALFNNGILYFAYNRAAEGHAVLSALNLASGVVTDLWSSSLTLTDDHYVPGLLVKSDGTMLAVYSRHQNDQFFTYRLSTSTNPVAAADWGPEQTNNTHTTVNTGMTYSNPFQLGAEAGKIYNFARYINYNPNVFTSTNGGMTWSDPQILIQTGSGSTRPYVKYCSDYNQRIDFLYTDAHPDNFTNSLYHMYYQSGAFYKTDGTFLKSYTSLPILHDSGERGSVVYQYSNAAQSDPNQWIPTARAWCWEIAYQTNGNPVCVFQTKVDNVTGSNWFDARIYYYYAAWTGTNWQKRFIAQAGRPLYNGQPDYGGGMALDPQNPNVIYISTDAANPFDLSTTTNVALGAHYELWRGVTSDGGLTFNWQAATTNSTVDNLRPYVPRRNGGEPCVLWFRGTYTSYTSFSCSVVGLFTTTVSVVSQPKITYVDATSGAAGNTAFAADGIFTPTTNASGTDGLWRLRTLGNDATAFESGGDISTPGSALNGDSEDCPRLATTITNLSPGASYNIYAYFWSATDSPENWRIRASLTNSPGDLPLFTRSSQPAAVAGDFTVAPLLAESNRILFQAPLGIGIADANGSVVVYVDDDPASRTNVTNGWEFRSWYDGVGYAPVAPQAPMGLTATAGDGQVLLSWAAVSGATGYSVKNSTSSGGSYATIASGVTSLVFTNTGLTNGTTYYYVVSATNPGGESANSTEVSATPLSAFQFWQFQYFGCTNCAAADPDADPLGKGISNTNQFLLGLNPTNSASVFRIRSVVPLGNNVNVTWQTAGGRTNVVQAATGDANGGYSNNFADVAGAETVILGTGDIVTNYTDAGGATNTPARFYRIRWVP